MDLLGLESWASMLIEIGMGVLILALVLALVVEVVRNRRSANRVDTPVPPTPVPPTPVPPTPVPPTPVPPTLSLSVDTGRVRRLASRDPSGPDGFTAWKGKARGFELDVAPIVAIIERDQTSLKAEEGMLETEQEEIKEAIRREEAEIEDLEKGVSLLVVENLRVRENGLEILHRDGRIVRDRLVEVRLMLRNLEQSLA